MNEKEKKAVRMVKDGRSVEEVALTMEVNLFWLKMVTEGGK